MSDEFAGLPVYDERVRVPSDRDSLHLAAKFKAVEDGDHLGDLPSATVAYG